MIRSRKKSCNVWVKPAFLNIMTIEARKNTAEANAIDQVIAKDLKTFKENLKLACSFISKIKQLNLLL